MKKGTMFYGIVCFMLGAMVSGGGIAYAAGVMAEKSTTPFFLNGAPVEVDAYLINGNNYFKLRDIAALVDFGVTWNAASGTVGIDTMVGYTPEGTEVAVNKPEPEATPVLTAHHEQANPAVFNSAYTREAYDALRKCIANGGDSAPIPMSAETRTAMMSATTAVGCYPSYNLKSGANGTAYFQAAYSSAFGDAAAACQSFLGTLAGKSDSDKLYAIACHICDRLEYDAGSTATPRVAFASDGSKKGNCMSYAHSLQFLCDLADIPCVLVHSSTHQWNEVYVNGEWHSVDLTSFDIGYTDRGSATLLHTASELQGSIFEQTEPQLTRFAKELLVPGSTK